jgi:hypothetical protein
MSFWREIRNILKGLFKVNVNNNINFTININDNCHNTYNKQSRRFTINPQEIEKGDLKKLLQSCLEEDHPIILDSTQQLLDDFRAKEKNTHNQQLLKFFEGKIPPVDHAALRASLYLREVFNEHKDITVYKEQITRKWGERGKNICNLCTGYYFEDLIKPTYEQLVGEGNDKKKFITLYNVIVTETPFAIFINKGMKKAKIKQVIMSKLENLNKYGIKQINVHALGQSTIRRVEEVLGEIKTEKNITFEISYKEQTPQILFYRITIQ